MNALRDRRAPSRPSHPNRFQRLRAGGDPGVALVMVLGTAMVMTMLVLALAGFALSGYGSAKRDADWNASVAAAQAGIDDYLARLNEDEFYWAEPDGANPAMAGWVGVPGATNGAAFRYEVDTTTTATDGLVRLTARGRVADEVRTLTTTLRRGRFFDFVYFSDLETMDPANAAAYSGASWRNRDPATVCAPYSWAAGWNSRDSGCPAIYWQSSDVVEGRFHTNDQFFASGSPTFKGSVSSGCPVVGATAACGARPVWVPEPGRTTTPQFTSPPVGGVVLPMPASNTVMRAETVAPKTGCLFTGPTRIVLKPNGRMAVHSPNTRTANPCTGTTTTATAASGTPTLGVWNDDALLPPNGVVYVESVPQDQPAADCARPWVTSPTTVPRDATSGGPSYPLGTDVTPYGCRSGDVFIEGTLRGQLTVATANDVVLTGNLRYADGVSGTDVLGLVADNNVSVYHPVTTQQREIMGPAQMRDPEVWAAILAVRHSVNVQNYAYGRRGRLVVRGSIAQKWRGPVGSTATGSTTLTSGYDKDWQYDTRLAYLSPPKFLDPVAASWLPVEVAEATPAH